ncbi:MAG TPA: YicC/YloC family endoribonuclease [Chondromyces sp.]|nr:YicC/YloC family endoribonuclease [Chondromyces sp.]
MTGFGRSKTKSVQHTVTVEVKSVNHRFSEYHIRMPRQLMRIEDKIKKKLAQYIQRGRVELFVTIEGEGLVRRSLQVDWRLLEDYVKTIQRISAQFDLPEQIKLSDLLQRNELISVEESEAENDELEMLILKTVETAVKELVAMREVEGDRLKSDLLSLLEIFEQKLSDVKKLAPLVIDRYRERLESRLKEMMAGAIDESRILTETAIFAEKADIHEECIRLESHLLQFRSILSLSEPIGRKLDFMIQEMNREVNTIGSKGNSSEIAAVVVDLKTCLEKMKEQVQNIE